MIRAEQTVYTTANMDGKKGTRWWQKAAASPAQPSRRCGTTSTPAKCGLRTLGSLTPSQYLAMA